MRELFGPVAASDRSSRGGRFAIVLTTARDAPPPDRTLRRAVRFAGAPSRVLVSTTRGRSVGGPERIERWPGVRWIEQPRDLDTTPGLLLPLLHVLTRDPYGWVAVMPAEPVGAPAGSEWVATDDDRFADALGEGMAALEAQPGALVLVDDPRAGGPIGGATPVTLGRGSALARILRRHAPDWWNALTNAFFRPDDLDAVYARMAPSSVAATLRDAPDAVRPGARDGRAPARDRSAPA